MRARLTKLAKLTPRDCWGVGVAYLYLLWAGWRLFIRHEKLHEWLLHEPAAPESPSLPAAQRAVLARRARWVNLAARSPLPWARCLQRSYALCLWLKRQGFQPELRIGVRRDGDSIQGHAWVEYGNQVINDSPLITREFTPLKGNNIGIARFGR